MNQIEGCVPAEFVELSPTGVSELVVAVELSPTEGTEPPEAVGYWSKGVKGLGDALG